MNRPTLFSDLDQTLIYSARSVVENNETTAGKLCVEQLEEKPLSFMSTDAWLLLKQHVNKTFDFVPVTTRHKTQYERITLPHVPIQYAIIENGATILNNGKRDIVWENKIQTQIDELETPVPEVYEKFHKKLIENEEVKNISNLTINPRFMYVVAKSVDKMDYIKNCIKQFASETGYVVSIQHRKVYLIPPFLTKVAAVNELKTRLGTTFAFAAGDTALDYTMESEVDFFIQPSHGETPTTTNNHHVTIKNGIESATEIIETVVQKIYDKYLTNLL